MDGGVDWLAGFDRGIEVGVDCLDLLGQRGAH